MTRLPKSRFCRDERGATAIIFAISMMPLMMAVGAAVDGSQWFTLKRQSAGMIDNALLAGARQAQLNPDDKDAALAAAQAYYDGKKTSLGGLATDTVAFVLTDNDTALTFTGEATMKTSFLTIVGIDKLVITSPAKAAFQTSGGNTGSDLEIALSLDVTGSMCDDGVGPCSSGTKISGLKAAAKDLVTIVMGNTGAGQKSRIAIVPWATNVRLARDGEGTALTSAITNLPETLSAYINECISGTGSGGSETSGNWVCTQWAPRYYTNMKLIPCVTDRFYDSTNSAETTDAPPGTGIWPNAVSGRRYPLSADSSDTTPASGRGSSAADPLYYWNHSPWASCWDSMESNIVMPLTDNETALKNRIDDLQGYASTGGALGTAWAYYMLSPRWASIWSGTSAPGSYSDVAAKSSSGSPVLRKVAVLMTDGDYNTGRGWKEIDQKIVSGAAVKICENMKKDGIEVFTVGFNLDALSSAKRTMAEDTLRQCGTSLNHFYQTLNVEQLKAAFRDIALKVKPVRLTQ